MRGKVDKGDWMTGTKTQLGRRDDSLLHSEMTTVQSKLLYVLWQSRREELEVSKDKENIKTGKC